MFKFPGENKHAMAKMCV